MLDTNAYSAWKRADSAVSALIRSSTTLLISPVVLGELISGYRRGSRYAANMQELREFLADIDVRVPPIGAATADRYARVHEHLRGHGTPIPTNDMWIAAQALETGAELVSYDRHFRHVGGLAWLLPA